MIQHIKVDLKIVRRGDATGNCFALNDNYYCHFESITLENSEAYIPLLLFFVQFSPNQFPEILENALIDIPSYTWPNVLRTHPYLFTKGPCDLDIYGDEYYGKLLHVNRNEVYVVVAFYDFNEEEVVPLLHFYQVLLLLSEKILELAREYGTVAYYQKVEPLHYNPKWDQDMERLIGLLRERIAEESTRDD